MHADATFPRLENKVWFENTKLNVWANEWILYHEINKEACRRDLPGNAQQI